MRKFLLLSSAGLVMILASGCAHTGTGFHAKGQFADLTAPVATVAFTNQLDPELLKVGDDLFTLGPGDRLEIEVVGQSNTRTLTFVGPDGKIYYHLLPGLDVWGLTLPQAREMLEKELGKYLSSPQVSLTLREVASKYVWLLGRLNRPGIYPLTSPITLLESLALAGGTARSTSPTSSQELADLRHSFVMRNGQILPVDFYRLLHEGDTSQNIVLKPDDFVYVPSALGQEVYVLGAVNAPRAIPYTEQMSLISALAGSAGPAKWDFLSTSYSGLVKDAYLSHVAIVRGSLSTPQIAVVDANAIMKGKIPDVPLEPGDIIYVPNSPYRWLKNYANLILNTFVTTVAANEGVHAGGGTAGVGVSVPVGGH